MTAANEDALGFRCRGRLEGTARLVSWPALPPLVPTDRLHRNTADRAGHYPYRRVCPQTSHFAWSDETILCRVTARDFVTFALASRITTASASD